MVGPWGKIAKTGFFWTTSDRRTTFLDYCGNVSKHCPSENTSNVPKKAMRVLSTAELCSTAVNFKHATRDKIKTSVKQRQETPPTMIKCTVVVLLAVVIIIIIIVMATIDKACVRSHG